MSHRSSACMVIDSNDNNDKLHLSGSILKFQSCLLPVFPVLSPDCQLAIVR